jgi:serine/threonine-protein kinase
MAIKVLHPYIAEDPVAVERFKREYETAAELRHPHVVSVHEFGSTPEGSYFMTMEYLYGEELSTAIRRDGAQPMSRALQTLCQSALALDHAHSFGVVHRDLKPDNIFLCKREAGDDIRLLDFGSVKLQMETGPKLTAFGTTLGSPYYMSPEQAMGKSDVDQRTDVFAVTAILYEMLTGRVAFEGDNVAAILMRIINGEPTPASMLNPDIPATLDAVIEKGVAKDKTKRFGSVSALADAALASLGLRGTAKDWAGKSVAEIEDALSRATPPSPGAYGVDAGFPPADGPREEPADALPQSSTLKWVALGAGALMLLSIVSACAWVALR